MCFVFLSLCAVHWDTSATNELEPAHTLLLLRYFVDSCRRPLFLLFFFSFNVCDFRVTMHTERQTLRLLCMSLYFYYWKRNRNRKKGQERKGGAERIFCDAFKMFFFSSPSFFSSDVKLFGFVVT